ncbi:hypothetical protein GCM10025879_12400 [Leuconostoc litchii]|nr:hypothetical protein GCM10025879_12400 [Leuconostoc litchii]
MFNAYYYDVTNALKPLLSWVEVLTQAVYDAVYRGLVGRLGRQQATRVTCCSSWSYFTIDLRYINV